MNKRIVLTLTLVSIVCFPLHFASQFVSAQSTAGAILNSDGSITWSSLIERNGDVYTLTGNISGGLQIQKTGITINGAGFALIGDGNGRGIDLSSNLGEQSVYSLLRM